jgi:hypothetical protein
VRELIQNALVPVMEARRDAVKTKEEKERALLSLTICDPAAGSGHFLLAAARRVGRELATVRSGEAEPAPETYRAALRDVIRHCLYAVDKNPLAVDLCKVALWIEGHSPGLPLSFLDHRIRCGDSLIGVFDLDVLKAGVPDDAFKRLTGDDQAVCAELRRINRRDRGGELAKFSAESILAELAGEFAALADMPDETPGDVHSKEELYRQLKESERAARLRNACDAWTAAFFSPRGSGRERAAPTTADVWNALNGLPNHRRAAIIDELAQRFRFFHWRLEFPEAFARGGFDVMLGNPPWERIKLQEKKFFAARDHDIATAPNKAARQKLIRQLFSPEATETQSVLAQAFVLAKRAADAEGLFVRASGRFLLTAVGDANTYALFGELFSRTISSSSDPPSRSGFIAPIGIATDGTTSGFFCWLSSQKRLLQLLDFQSGGGFFDDIGHARFKFALITVAGENAAGSGHVRLGFFLRRMADFAQSERFFELDAGEIKLLNPNTKTLPIFRSSADPGLTKQIYSRVPALVTQNEHAETNPWKFDYATKLFDMADDSEIFRTATQLATAGLQRDGSDWIGPGGSRHVPLYEAKMVHHFDHRWASYDEKAIGDDDAIRPSDGEKADPAFFARPRYWVPIVEVDRRLIAKGWLRPWLMGWRDIRNAANERTVIATALPRVAVGHTIRLMSVGTAHPLAAAFVTMAGTIVFDFIARQKVGGTHLTVEMWQQLAVLPPSTFQRMELDFITPRTLELVYTAADMRSFAKDLGYDGPSFGWDPDRRAVLKAELDAYFAYLYGLSRDELRYILDPKEVMGADYPSETFRVLKENEIRAYGEYRTRRLVLEAWDRFAEDGTFDPARLRDPTHFDAVQRALVETRGRVESLECELQELLVRSDATPLPTLFVEGESDVAILIAAWQAFHPAEPLPVTILAAGGTLQMRSLAGKGAALRQVLGDRIVFALADNDREGRELVEHDSTKRGGAWRQQSNGVYWCLLAPTAEFQQALKLFAIPEAFWPFTIENAFLAALRRQAIAEGAYAFEEAVIQSSFQADAGIANKALRAAHQLDRAEDDAVLYFRPPAPETKAAFAQWIAASERRDRSTFAAFGPILDGLVTILANRAGQSGVKEVSASAPGIARS